MVLTGIMGSVLLVFAGWHLYIIGSGCTTNEMQKWSGLKAFLAERWRRDNIVYEQALEAYDNQQKAILAGEVTKEELEDKKELFDAVPKRPTNWQKRMGNEYNLGRDGMKKNRGGRFMYESWDGHCVVLVVVLLLPSAICSFE